MFWWGGGEYSIDNNFFSSSVKGMSRGVEERKFWVCLVKIIGLIWLEFKEYGW